MTPKQILNLVLCKYSDHPQWNESDFESIKRISNTKVGQVGEDFIESLCKDLQIETEFPLHEKGGRKKRSSWDIKIMSVTFEVKTATLDTVKNFQFNHVRFHREYDALLCLGISPNDILFNVWSKADVVTKKAGNLASMDKGSSATWKLTKKPAALYPIDKFSEIIIPFVETF